jgi:hypothetical protein
VFIYRKLWICAARTVGDDRTNDKPTIWIIGKTSKQAPQRLEAACEKFHKALADPRGLGAYCGTPKA